MRTRTYRVQLSGPGAERSPGLEQPRSCLLREVRIRQGSAAAQAWTRKAGVFTFDSVPPCPTDANPQADVTSLRGVSH